MLYQELLDNQNKFPSTPYQIKETNRVLTLLVSDAEFAHKNDIYKPVGDYALTYLDQLARDSANDLYNRVPDGIPDPMATNSPLYASVRFFDAMVGAAIYQGVEWHMWLYYLPLITKKVVRNYRLADPLADPDDEFPIRYSFLLYQILSTLKDWVLELERLPLDQANVVLSSTRADHENGNIPKSSILALGQCTRFVLETDNLTSKMKNYLVEMGFDLYFQLKETGDIRLHNYATVLGRALRQGGTYKPRNDGNYEALLINAFEDQEDEYRIKHSDTVVDELKGTLEGQ